MILAPWMITFLRYRFYVGLAIFALGLALIFVIGGEWAWLFWVPGLILIISHLFIGTAAAASQVLQMGDTDGAEQLLKATINPKWLYSTFRSNYYMVEGMLAMSRNDAQTAESKMQEAMRLNAGSPSEQAVMYFNLGMMAMQQNKMKEATDQWQKGLNLGMPDEQAAAVYLNFAMIELNKVGQAVQATRRPPNPVALRIVKEHYAKAKSYKSTNPQIKEGLAQVEAALKQLGGGR